MGIEENKKTLQRYFDELMNKQEYSRADEILHEDYTGAALGGLKGLQGHKQYIKQLHSAFSDYSVKTLDMVAEGDKISVFLEASGTHDGNFYGIPPTGTNFSIKQASVYELKDGKVYRGLSMTVMDQLALFQQLGVLPSLPEAVKAYNESKK